MINIDIFIKQFSTVITHGENLMPWEITDNLSSIVKDLLMKLDDNFTIKDDIAIHKSATIEQNVVLKGPVIIGENCFVGANAYIRGGTFLDKAVRIGPGCEIKQSIICSGSAMAHFNYIGNSIIGHEVNLEAGSVIANHYNERVEKEISVLYHSRIMQTHVEKFGALVGDYSKIGANAVLSPGTLLAANSVVRRLELIDQLNTAEK